MKIKSILSLLVVALVLLIDYGVESRKTVTRRIVRRSSGGSGIFRPTPMVHHVAPRPVV